MTKAVRLYQARTPSAQPSHRPCPYVLLTLFSFMQVDAFTTRRFSGNPAAVCILENEISDGVMQQIAAEMNLSETAFVRRLPSAAEGYDSPMISCYAQAQMLTLLACLMHPALGLPAGNQRSALCREYSLRWFTPAMEVPLCGHATVATAAALLEGEGLQCSELRFQTVHCGVLTVTREDGLYHLSVPLLAPGNPHPSIAQPCNAISKVHSHCTRPLQYPAS